VIYVSDRRQDFIQGFYEGPLYSYEDLFDDSIEKRESKLQPSLHVYMSRLKADSIKDIVDKHGGTIDQVWVSGDADWAGFANQVSVWYNAPLIHGDRGDLSPCVNQIQLGHVLSTTDRKKRVISCADGYTRRECLDLIHVVKTLRDRGIRDLGLYLVGRRVQNMAEMLDEFSDFHIVHHTTDRGRMRAIRESMVYVHPRHNMSLAPVVEAMCCGTPVAMCVDRKAPLPHLRGSGVFGNALMCECFGDIPPDTHQISRILCDVSVWQKMSKGASAEGKKYGFARRMLDLYISFSGALEELEA